MIDKGKRDSVLDITKGFGIIFMVLGHIHFSDDVFNKYVYAFHMPLFFIVSGMLFNENKNIKETLKSRARSLLVPYISFGGIYIFIYIVKCLLFHDVNSIKSALKIMLLFPTNGFPFESALWFLPVMFLTGIGYAVIRKYLTLKWTSFVVLLIGIVGFIFPKFIDMRLPWGIDSACVALLFFHTGYIIKHFVLFEKIKKYKSKNKLLFCLLLLLVICLNTLLIFLNEKVNMRTLDYGNPVLTFLNAVVGTLIWICFSYFINSFSKMTIIKLILCRISELSIVFLCINHNAILVFRVLLSKIFKMIGFSTGVLDIVLIFIFSMAFMFCVGIVIDKTNLRIMLGRGLINDKR